MLNLAEKEAIYEALRLGERLYLQVGSMVSLRGKLVCSRADVVALMQEFRNLCEMAGGVWGKGMSELKQPPTGRASSLDAGRDRGARPRATSHPAWDANAGQKAFSAPDTKPIPFAIRIGQTAAPRSAAREAEGCGRSRSRYCRDACAWRQS